MISIKQMLWAERAGRFTDAERGIATAAKLYLWIMAWELIRKGKPVTTSQLMRHTGAAHRQCRRLIHRFIAAELCELISGGGSGRKEMTVILK